MEGIKKRLALCVVNSLLEKRKEIIPRERHTVNGIEQSIIDFVLMSSDLMEHIEHIHVD